MPFEIDPLYEGYSFPALLLISDFATHLWFTEVKDSSILDF